MISSNVRARWHVEDSGRQTLGDTISLAMEFAVDRLLADDSYTRVQWEEVGDGSLSLSDGGQVMSLSDDEQRILDDLARRLSSEGLEYERLAKSIARRQALRLMSEVGAFCSGLALILIGLITWWSAAVAGEVLVAVAAVLFACRLRRRWTLRRRL